MMKRHEVEKMFKDRIEGMDDLYQAELDAKAEAAAK